MVGVPTACLSDWCVLADNAVYGIVWGGVEQYCIAADAGLCVGAMMPGCPDGDRPNIKLEGDRVRVGVSVHTAG